VTESVSEDLDIVLLRLFELRGELGESGYNGGCWRSWRSRDSGAIISPSRCRNAETADQLMDSRDIITYPWMVNVQEDMGALSGQEDDEAVADHHYFQSLESV